MRRPPANHPQTCARHAPGDLSCSPSCPDVLHPAPAAPEGPSASERQYTRDRIELAVADTVGPMLSPDRWNALVMRLWAEMGVAEPEHDPQAEPASSLECPDPGQDVRPPDVADIVEPEPAARSRRLRRLRSRRRARRVVEVKAS